MDTSSAALSGAPRNENFLKTAFNLKEKQISEPIVLNRNIVVLELTSIKDKAAEAIPSEKIADTIADYDQSSSSRMILSSKKLVNNLNDFLAKLSGSNN